MIHDLKSLTLSSFGQRVSRIMTERISDLLLNIIRLNLERIIVALDLFHE